MRNKLVHCVEGRNSAVAAMLLTSERTRSSWLASPSYWALPRVSKACRASFSDDEGDQLPLSWTVLEAIAVAVRVVAVVCLVDDGVVATACALGGSHGDAIGCIAQPGIGAQLLRPPLASCGAYAHTAVATGKDLDHTAYRIGAIQTGRRAAQHLDTVYLVDIDAAAPKVRCGG